MSRLLLKLPDQDALQIIEADACASGRLGYVSLKTVLGTLQFGGDRELLVDLLQGLLELLGPQDPLSVTPVQVPPTEQTLIQPHWKRWKIPPEGLTWPFILWCFATSKALAVGSYPITLDLFAEDMKSLRPVIKRLKAELGIDETLASSGDAQSYQNQDVATVRAKVNIADLFDENGELVWGAVATIKEALGFDRNMGGIAHQRARAVADYLKNTTTTTDIPDTIKNPVAARRAASAQ